MKTLLLYLIAALAVWLAFGALLFLALGVSPTTQAVNALALPVILAGAFVRRRRVLS